MHIHRTQEHFEVLLAQPPQVLEREAGQPAQRVWQRQDVGGGFDGAVDEVEVSELVKGAQLPDDVRGDAQVGERELAETLEEREAFCIPNLDNEVAAGFLHGDLPLLAHEVHRALVFCRQVAGNVGHQLHGHGGPHAFLWSPPQRVQCRLEGRDGSCARGAHLRNVAWPMQEDPEHTGEPTPLHRRESIRDRVDLGAHVDDRCRGGGGNV